MLLHVTLPRGGCHHSDRNLLAPTRLCELRRKSGMLGYTVQYSTAQHSIEVPFAAARERVACLCKPLGLIPVSVETRYCSRMVHHPIAAIITDLVSQIINYIVQIGDGIN